MHARDGSLEWRQESPSADLGDSGILGAWLKYRNSRFQVVDMREQVNVRFDE
jgi:hypothetical protein